jgi:hypothetical protein
MKLSFVAFLLCIQFSYGQSGRSFYYSEIAWTIIVPPDFNIIDSGTSARALKGGRDIVAQNTGTKLNISTAVHLLAAKKDNQTYFIAGYDSSSKINENNWQVIDVVSTESLFKSIAKAIPFKSDTLHSSETIGGVVFKKLQADFFISKKITHTVCLLRTYFRNVYFTITYSYDNEESLTEINSMLSSSTFKKQ